MGLCNCLWAHRLHTYRSAFPLFDPLLQLTHKGWDEVEGVSSLWGISYWSGFFFLCQTLCAAGQMDGFEHGVYCWAWQLKWSCQQGEDITLWSIPTGNKWGGWEMAELELDKHKVHIKCFILNVIYTILRDMKSKVITIYWMILKLMGHSGILVLHLQAFILGDNWERLFLECRKQFESNLIWLHCIWTTIWQKNIDWAP